MVRPSVKDLQRELATQANELRRIRLLNIGLDTDNKQREETIADLEAQNRNLRAAERRLTNTEAELEDARATIAQLRLQVEAGEVRTVTLRAEVNARAAAERQRDSWKAKYHDVMLILNQFTQLARQVELRDAPETPASAPPQRPASKRRRLQCSASGDDQSEAEQAPTQPMTQRRAPRPQTPRYLPTRTALTPSATPTKGGRPKSRSAVQDVKDEVKSEPDSDDPLAI